MVEIPDTNLSGSNLTIGNFTGTCCYADKIYIHGESYTQDSYIPNVSTLVKFITQDRSGMMFVLSIVNKWTAYKPNGGSWTTTTFDSPGTALLSPTVIYSDSSTLVSFYIKDGRLYIVMSNTLHTSNGEKYFIAMWN